MRFFSHRMLAQVTTVLLLTVVIAPAQKQKNNPANYDPTARATVLHEAIVYVTAEPDAQRVSTVAPGREVVIVQKSGPWVQVFANTDSDSTNDANKPEFSDDSDKPTPSSGWIHNKGIVGPTTPNGDSILYGAAANYEAEAEQPHSPQGAAMAAHLLYERVTDYFPQSPLAPAAMWRAADIRWQLDRRDISTLPSAKEQEAYLRPQIYEGDMKKVMKTYPGTKFAALAAYDMLDNKLCGSWQGLPKCPEMESSLYEKYAQRYPDSPKAPEALYNATYRQGVAVTMYMVQDDKRHSEDAAKRTADLAAEMKERYPQSDYTARAAAIAYKVQQGIPIYGSDRE
ncbi:MAG TPA: hypothetical protein VFE38_04505 [Edaphobacter sp.]|nr:hypothetical protein [Edaphobacter sp.]